jgi:hypothetical protein
MQRQPIDDCVNLASLRSLIFCTATVTVPNGVRSRLRGQFEVSNIPCKVDSEARPMNSLKTAEQSGWRMPLEGVSG